MRIYISGPIKGTDDYMERFDAVAEELQAEHKSAEIINPAKVNANLPKSTTHDEYMNICLVMLEMADAVFMMHGWETSTGACVEYGYSLAMDKLILLEDTI